MPLFAITTVGESGKEYVYVVQQEDAPTPLELDAMLIAYAHERDDLSILEEIKIVVDVSPRSILHIPEMSIEEIEKWNFLTTTTWDFT